MASNGVVHVIDAVLFPPLPTIADIVIASPDHETLETAVVAAGLVDILNSPGPFTVFAPTDDAFAALPPGALDALLADPNGALANVLLYHAAAGAVMSSDLSDGQMITTAQGEDVMVTINMDGVFINDAQVTVADIMASNGVVHVIDAVLFPPLPTIADIVIASPDHETLEAAVVAAGLVDILNSPGPFTVFAPTDDAFAALPDGTLDALLADPNGALTQVLLYHAVPGVALSSDLNDGQMITTAQGEDLMVTINTDGVFINNAKVIVADIIASNGVVHVIDAVLVPTSVSVKETAAAIDHNIQITPNPASAFFTIKKENTANISATLFNPNGKLIDNKLINTQYYDWPIEHLSNGTYFLQIATEGKILHQKIVICN